MNSMKLKLLLLFFLSSSVLISQKEYKGFAIAGSSLARTSQSSSSDFIQINSRIQVQYFLNKNHYVSLNPLFLYSNGSGFEGDLDVRIGLGYGYIHWFADRIGLESSISLNQIATDDFNARLSLELVARATDNLDIRFRLTHATIFNEFTFSNSSNTSVTRTESRRISIPNTLGSSVSIRYRIPNSFTPKDESNYESTNKRNLGITATFSKNERSRTSLDPSGELEISQREQLTLGAGFMINPFDQISYGARINYSKISSSDFETDYLQITPEIRKNWLYTDGFGFYAKAGPTVGLYLDDTSDVTFGLVGDAGFTYIIKERVMLDLSFTSFNSFFRTTGGFNMFNLNFSPLRTPNLGATVAF